MKNIHTYNIFINESIKDKLKGKSDDEIFDTLDKMNINKLNNTIINFIVNGDYKLVKYCLDNDLFNKKLIKNNNLIDIAKTYNNNDIVNLLLNNEKYMNIVVDNLYDEFKKELHYVRGNIIGVDIIHTKFDLSDFKYRIKKYNLTIEKEYNKGFYLVGNIKDVIKFYIDIYKSFDILYRIDGDARLYNAFSDVGVNFINESIRDKMKGKVSKEEFDTYMDNLIADIAQGVLNHEKYNNIFSYHLDDCYKFIINYYYNQILDSIENSISRKVIIDVFVNEIVQDLNDL